MPGDPPCTVVYFEFMAHRARRITEIRLGLCLVLTAVMASAATDITEAKHATVRTTTAHVLEVLGSSDICESGCKYYGPQTVREIKVAVRATPDSYYKWTHISGIKTVKFFKHVKVTPGGPNGVTKVDMRCLTEEGDAALIKELEDKTKLEHSPAFDASTATFTITPQVDQVDIKISAMTRLSGVMGMFAGAARKSMKESLDAMMANFAR